MDGDFFMTKKIIKCISCRFAKKDADISKEKWTAYICSNTKSEYYKSLLNVDLVGNKLEVVTWKGCRYGERRVDK